DTPQLGDSGEHLPHRRRVSRRPRGDRALRRAGAANAARRLDAAVRLRQRSDRRSPAHRLRLHSLDAAWRAGKPPRVRRGAQGLVTIRDARKPTKESERAERPVALAAIGLESEFAIVLDGKPAKPEDVFGSPTRIVR